MSELAEIRLQHGPSMIRDENGLLAAYVFVDFDTSQRDVGGFVDDAKRAVERQLRPTPGYTLLWSGQFENMLPILWSMSVTVPRVVDWITLRFGLHVEHHLFPSMASSRLPALRELVRARWPERYQSLPLVTALARLHRTARVYKDDTTLVDPRSGRAWPTLLPRSADFSCRTIRSTRARTSPPGPPARPPTAA